MQNRRRWLDYNLVRKRRVIISEGGHPLILFVTSQFPLSDIKGPEKNPPHTGTALKMPSASPAPSSSSSRSSTPPKVKKLKSKQEKQKGKTESTAAASQPRNEGTDPTWNYAPPPDAVLVNDNVDAGEFDWDTIHDNDDLELWLIRVPESVSLPNVF